MANRKHRKKSGTVPVQKAQSTTAPVSAAPTVEKSSSYDAMLARFGSLVNGYNAQIGMSGVENAFTRAMDNLMANNAPLQNARVKGISPFPVNFTKEQIGNYIRNPYYSELPLQQASTALRSANYPYFKINKTYQDILTYRHYTKPLYLDAESAKTSEFMREARLVDKISKSISPEATAHKIAGQTLNLGKTFYYLRYDVDKAHNRVNHAFLQQLPQRWCQVIGFNNVSGYTVSFDMMYFCEYGTDLAQFGDLFTPYIDDFAAMFEDDRQLIKDGRLLRNPFNGRLFNPERLRGNAAGNPQVIKSDDKERGKWVQNGRYAYFVSLPIDKIWTFEIDDVSPAAVTPFTGLFLTYGQQNDFEDAQLALLVQPLAKIFTGEIPYYTANSAKEDNGYRMTINAVYMFQAMFNALMAQSGTGGTAFYAAPYENIKSHDYSESANANSISETFNRYGMEKAGLAALIPVSEDVKAAQVDVSKRLEARFADRIYRQFERMMNTLYDSLNLRYEWEFVMFGSIFTDDDTREKAQKALAIGDTSAMFTLAALDGDSWLDKLSMVRAINESGIMDELIVPQTAYTQSNRTTAASDGTSDAGGRPKSEKMTDAIEKSIDTGTITE